jgi:tricorn protease
MSELTIVSLTKLDKNPADRDVDEEDLASLATPPAGGRGGAGAGAAAIVPDVKFDWEGIQRRGRRLAQMAGGIANLVSSPDGRSMAFVNGGGGGGGGRGGAAAGGGSTLYTVAVDTGALTRVTQATPPAPAADDAPPAAAGGFAGGISNVQWARDGRTLYFREGRSIYSATVGATGGTAAAAPAAAAATGGRGGRGGAASTPTPATTGNDAARRINFTVKIEVDHRAERKEIFEESWRIMKHRFYDANMHGADWNKAKQTYEALLADTYDKEEMGNIIVQMIGEMNASHTGFTPFLGTPREAQTRYPGFEFVADSSAGYYKVGFIYRDGPADHEYVKIHAGDYILAIDDQPVKSGDNYWKNLTIAPGRKFKFLVNNKPSRDGAWDVRIEPVNQGAFTNLQYEKWVRDRRAMVEKASSGEIGYVHIRAMDEPSLRRFERELAENHAKKALVIDQRFNGGGGIDQELLQILNQRTRYQYTRNRGSEADVDRPLRAFFGPMVVMENERSASDAEMFPAGFKDLHLGKVIGVNSMGAVIGTGSYTLVDGSTIRTPGSGVWTLSGQNMENFGVPPDVYIDNTPGDFMAGRDAQIDKAIEVLKEELKKKL